MNSEWNIPTDFYQEDADDLPTYEELDAEFTKAVHDNVSLLETLYEREREIYKLKQLVAHQGRITYKLLEIIDVIPLPDDNPPLKTLLKGIADSIRAVTGMVIMSVMDFDEDEEE